ncbi:MAG: ABC transporter ATP-binding protein [Chloroflexi bacterium]|nr:ABC transporter ATP-binding protein [Chloroflexota bacterium]
MLQIQHLSKTYATTPVLNDVSFDVPSGSIVCLLGPSGSGKSTLLRIIAGLEVQNSGHVLLDGNVIDAIPTHQRGFGFMFQEFALFPHRTVAQNVAFGLRMQHRPQAEIKRGVDEQLALVGLDPARFSERAIDQLSGGERQRVALARSLAPQPRLLMLDEPLGSLDRILREQLIGELRQLIKRLGLTAIYVTHDQAEAFVLADQIVLMQAGRIAQIGTPAQLYRSPNSIFTAQFLGLNNIVTGQVVAFEGDLVGVETVLGRLWVLARHEAIPAIHTAINIVIRPEAAQCPDPNRPMRNHITGEVINRSFRGASQRIHLRHISGHVFAFDWVDDGLPSPLSIQLLPEAMSLIG